MWLQKDKSATDLGCHDDDGYGGAYDVKLNNFDCKQVIAEVKLQIFTPLMNLRKKKVHLVNFNVCDDHFCVHAVNQLGLTS